ncbi:ribosome biogenesis protein Nop53/GLTSCR2 [Lipomyces oligophaga]|uniref:ribosome biogenesis protein Nop53/GLTSCR2 n=1 Tax=Lipomyces oligophaga TaxID=45792 RepID=UPI0034CFB2E5
MDAKAGKPKIQTSRKGKRAWRKNVDISQLEDGLERVREERIRIGTTYGEVEPEKLFAVDIIPSEEVRRKLGQKQLKADQILSERSAIPALISKKRALEQATYDRKNKGKVQGVSYKDLARLLRKAGRQADAKTSLENFVPDSYVRGKLYDVWADDASTGTIGDNSGSLEKKKAKDLLSNSEEINLPGTTSWTKFQKPPITLSEPPIKMKNISRSVELPREGQSYNPSLESWQALLKEEHTKVHREEKDRIRKEEEEEQIRILGERLDERERLGLDQLDSDAEDNEDQNIENSNVTVKTEDHSDLKPDFTSTVAKVLQEPESKSKSKSKSKIKPDLAIRKHKLGKYRLAERPMALKLSDELTDSLRLLKPEGNLAKDRFISLQERGIIEARKQVLKGRKYKLQYTEKWSYKDFK